MFDTITAEYLILAVLVFGLNVIPAFMPATWTILAFFYIRYHLLLLPVVVIGALSATAGRIVLYSLSKQFIHPLLRGQTKENLTALGNFLNTNQKLAFTVVLAYAYLPVPSNQVFIAAGLASVNIKIIALSFLIGRLISYTLWVALANHVAQSLEGIFIRHYTRIGATIAEILSLATLVAITKIPWKKLLKKVNH